MAAETDKERRRLFATLLVVCAQLLVVTSSPTAYGRNVYVTNYGPDTVGRIDTATNTLAGSTTAVGTDPIGIALTPNGSRAYIANEGSNNVSVINTSTNAVVATVAVGTQPNAVAITPDGTRAYVTNYLDGSVSVINTSTNTVSATINSVATLPEGIAITPDGTRVYVADADYFVKVINTATNAVTDTIAVSGGPIAIAVTPDGSRVYVANYVGGTVSVINTSTNTVSNTITVGTNPRGISISPNGTRAYVSNGGSNSVSVINTSTNAVIGTVTVGTAPMSGVAVTPDGSRVYVPGYSGNDVSVIDASTNTVTATISSPANNPRHVAIVPNQPPTASFTATTSEAGSATGFNATTSTDSDGTVSQYDWDFGDGQTLTNGGATPTHTYAVSGTYAVTLTVTDDEDCKTSGVFTGLTMSCNGSAVAQTTRSVAVSAATPPAQLASPPAQLASPQAPSLKDTRAPRVTISSGPDEETREISATFAFSADEEQVGFQCRLDWDAWAACGSPEIVYGLSLGRHAFYVRAQDRAGNTGPTVSWEWTVDRRAPTLKRANIKRRARVPRSSLTHIYGYAVTTGTSPPRVKVKLELLSKSAKLDWGDCAFLSLKTGNRIVHACDGGFTEVEGGGRWRLDVPAAVRRALQPSVRYRLLIRTRDAAGNKRLYRVPFVVT